MTSLFDLTGKVALVTGASKGIGEAIALLYGAAGARVVVSSRKQESVDLVADSIIKKGGQAKGIAIPAKHGQRSWRIVRPDEVELDGNDIGVVRAQQLHEPRAEGRAVERPDVLRVLVMTGDDIHVQAGPPDEAQDGLGQRVVHERVESVAT